MAPKPMKPTFSMPQISIAFFGIARIFERAARLCVIDSLMSTMRWFSSPRFFDKEAGRVRVVAMLVGNALGRTRWGWIKLDQI
jgi:hypothetical protein